MSMDKLDYAFTDTRKRREKLIINPKDIELETESIDVDTLNSIFKTNDDVSYGNSEYKVDA